MLKDTRHKMIAHAYDLRPCSDRAQCLNIANLHLVQDETIANLILHDHSTQHSALRAMLLMANAGAATHESASSDLFGTFTFEDGSTYKA